MTRHRILLISLLACFALSTAEAGGPVYSRFGIGDLYYFAGSRSYGMGGAGVGLFGDGFINRINPAGLAAISRTRFSGTFEYSNYRSTDPKGTAPYARGDFGGLAVAIPVARDYGVVIVGELTPYSMVNYAMQRDDKQFGIASYQEYYGSGGISRFDFGSSVSLSNHLHFGIKLDYLAGTVTQTTKITFTDNSYSNNELTYSDYYSGAMFTIGATWTGVGDILNSSALSPLSLGFVIETPTSLDLRREHLTTTAKVVDTTLTEYGTADVPLFIAAGASYRVSERVLFAADAAVQSWSSAKILGSHPPELRNSARISAGVEIQPSKDASTYLQHMVYRAGFYYNSSYIQATTDPATSPYQAINGTFLTLGLGLPIGPDAHLNLGFQYGTNGTTQNALQKDTIFRLTASISGSELWFFRPQED